MLTATWLLLTAAVAAIAAPVARTLSRALQALAVALDDVSVTTLSIAFGRLDRRVPSGERARRAEDLGREQRVQTSNREGQA